MKQNIREFNLFNGVSQSQDANVLQQQRYTTRVYLILLVLAVMSLTLITSTRLQTNRVIIKLPSLKDFIQLYYQYPRTINCPCSQTAVERQLISHIKPQYHEVCSSEFVSSNWINAQFVQSSPWGLVTRDIRYQSQFHFQLLATLCQMANQTIQDSLQSYYRTKLITSQALSPKSFQAQVDFSVEEFKRTVPESFQRTLNLLKANFEINQFITPMNSWFSSFLRWSDTGYPMFYFITFFYRWPERPGCDLASNYGCYCVSLSPYPCYRETTIDESGTSFIIPGMFQTWFPLQSLLNSTLECFYTDSCLSRITQFINLTVSRTNFTTLKASSLSLINNQYDRIESLADNLFIQSWQNESSFESYFDSCRPLTCQYTYETRLNLVYIVTTTLGLIGGFNVVLRLLLPFVVVAISRIHKSFFQHQEEITIVLRETKPSKPRKRIHTKRL